MKNGKAKILSAAGAGTAVLVVLAGMLAAVGTVRAEEGGGRAGSIKSRGVIDYAGGAVVIDASDLTGLANEIDALEEACKSGMLKALNDINTYIRTDGTVTHQAPGEQLQLPSFGQLADAVRASQSFASAREDLAGDLYFRTENGGLVRASEDGSGEPVDLCAASAGNLSAGTVAYVDGQLLLGTGADNQTYYDLGYQKSKQEIAEQAEQLRADTITIKVKDPSSGQLSLANASEGYNVYFGFNSSDQIAFQNMRPVSGSLKASLSYNNEDISLGNRPKIVCRQPVTLTADHAISATVVVIATFNIWCRDHYQAPIKNFNPEPQILYFNFDHSDTSDSVTIPKTADYYFPMDDYSFGADVVIQGTAILPLLE